MKIVRINFSSSRFEDDFLKVLKEVFPLVRPSFHGYESLWHPHVDVCESTEEIIVLADVAGLPKDEIRIEVDRDKVKISGFRKPIPLKQNVRYHQAEIPHGYFERQIDLPSPVEVDSARASYTDGILIVTIKKRLMGKAHRVKIVSEP